MANVRTDSWAAQLSEEQQWELFQTAKQPNMTWTKAVQWAVTTFGLARKPGQAAFYRWKAAMRKAEFEHKLEEAAVARDEIVALGKNAAKMEDIVAMLQARAAIALTIDNDINAAKALLQTADMVQAIVLKQNKVRLQEHTEKLLDEQIAGQRLRNQHLDHELKQKTEPPQRLTPEERERRIKEIFGMA